jgi:tetratricopeptide (TPR) repeat protein
MKTKSTLFLLLTIVFLQTTLWGQTSLTDADRAVVKFDIEIQRLVADGKAKSIDLAPFLDAKLPGPLNSLEVSDISRIEGALTLPKQFSQITEMGPGKDLPVEGFIRIQLVSDEAGKRFDEQLSATSLVTTAADGTKQYRSKSQNDPQNMLFRMASPREFEFLTTKFLSTPDRSFKTALLQSKWDALPKTPIRIAADLKTNNQFIKELAQSLAESDPQAAAYAGLLPKLEALGLSIGVSEENLFDFVAVANTTEDAQEIQSAINGLLFLAKAQAKSMLGSTSNSESQLATQGNKVLEELSATQNKNEVQIKVAVPDGLGAAFAEVALQVRQRALEVTRQNNLRMAILGALNFESAHAKFPFNFSQTSKVNSDLSWRALVSPFVEGPSELDISKSPADPQNARFAEQMPSCFGEGKTHSTISWVKSDVKGFADIKDGSSNTICLIENPQGKTPWLKRNDISQQDAIKLVMTLAPGEKINVAYYDGSVQTLTRETGEEALKLLFDPNDGGVQQANPATQPTTTESSANPQKAQLEKQLADAKSAFEKACSENNGIHLAAARQLVDVYVANGMKAEALAVVEKQKERVDAALGLASEDALNVRFLLARATAQTQGLEAGIAVLQSFVDLRSKELGEGHVETFEAREGMAGFLWGSKQQKRAVELQQESIEKLKALVGADSIRTLAATKQLADYFYEAKVYEQAAPIYESVFSKRETVSAEPGRDIFFGCALNLGIIYLNTDPAKAVDKFKFALGKQDQLNADPKKFPRLIRAKLRTQNLLGQAYFRSGDLDKAEETFQSLVANASVDEQFIEQQIEADARLATILQRRGQLDAAAKKMKEVADRANEKLGKSHRFTAMCRQTLYGMYSQLPAIPPEEKKNLATSLFENFVVAKGHLQPCQVDPKGTSGNFSMVTVANGKAPLFAIENGQAKFAGTVDKGERLSVSRYNSFEEVYVPKLKRRCWIFSQDTNRLVFSPEVHKQIFEEAASSFKQASSSVEKIGILQKQISLATSEVAAHPVIGLFYGDLSDEYQQSGDLDNAIKSKRKSIEMLSLKGPDDLGFLMTKIDLAKLLRSKQQVAESNQIVAEVSNEMSAQLDDPSKDRDSVCFLGNKTIWAAVWPAGSKVAPEQVSLMQKIVAVQPRGMYFNTLGVVFYRVGKYEQAIKACQQSIEKTPVELGLSQPHPADFAFTAMSHHQLGNEALAAEFKAKAEAGAKQDAFKNDAELIGIVKELQATFGEAKPIASTP